uniref:Uncharacterized protein n=1 Tax=Pelusios castaneus TaxID=367368 RepID=A0A8C8R9C1_9SAUR
YLRAGPSRHVRLYAAPRAPAAWARAALAPDSASSLQASAVGLSAFFLGLLVPSGWILANLEHYKKRD